MKSVLLAGIPAEIGVWLAAEIPGIRCFAAATPAQAEEMLNGQEFDLLVLDESVGSALLQRSHRPKAIYCLGSMEQVGLMFRLVHEMRVEVLLVHPLDPDELLRHVRELLAIPLQQRVKARLDEKMARLWQKHLPDLQSKARRLLELRQHSSEEERIQAQRAAHQLAGTIGTFELAEASEQAREAEGLIKAGSEIRRVNELGRVILAALGVEVAPPPPTHWWEGALEQLQQFALDDSPQLRETALRSAAFLRNGAELAGWPEVVRAAAEVERDPSATAIASLRRELKRTAGGGSPPSGAQRRLLLCGRAARWPELSLAAGFQGFQVVTSDPDVAILDFAEEDFYEVLGRLQPVRTLAYMAGAGAGEVAEASRIGLSGLVDPSMTASEVLQLADELLDLRTGRILAVDDDPVVLAMLDTLLLDAGFNVTTLSDPLRFLEELERCQPELLLLDVDMPGLNGVELCRAARRHQRWKHLPIVFLTAQRDGQAIERVFQAGADDYVLKPVVGPELLTRIRTRLSRHGGDRPKPKLASLLALAQRLQISLCLILFSGIEINLRPLCQPGDWCGSLGSRQCLALLATGRESGRLRALDIIKDQPQARAAVVCFPADGRELTPLLASLENALEQARPSVVAVASARPGEEHTHDVLLVDDDDVMADLAEAALQNFSFCRLPNGSSARESVLQQRTIRPRVLLLDINLPDMSGLDFLAELKVLRRTRVIMLTGQSDAVVYQAIEAGAFDFVAKPVRAPVLEARVRRALDSLG